jgi:DNA-directed RNA polymerase specialized sigma24 family protein
LKETILCRRDAVGRVTGQSEACARICSNRIGDHCKDRCALHIDYETTWSGKKTKLVSGRVIGDQAFDIVFAPDAEGATTILFKVDRPVRPDFMQMLHDYALTKREFIVAKMIEQGFTNRGISERLYISLATVKTHINRIYSKLGIHAGILSDMRMN